jgi:hypothetical protein
MLPAMRVFLQQKIIERRQRLIALDRERSAVQAELGVYEEMLANLPDDPTAAAEPTTDSSHLDDRVKLNITRAWVAILDRLAPFKHFNASEVMLVARELFKEKILSKEQTKDGIRAQLSQYTKRGLIKRLGGGNYRLTEPTKASLILYSNRSPYRQGASNALTSQ